MQAEERVTLAALRLQGMSLWRIAGLLGRSAGTLSRELARNSVDGAYVSMDAHRTCQAR
jgi:transposase, IS30 family